MVQTVQCMCCVHGRGLFYYALQRVGVTTLLRYYAHLGVVIYYVTTLLCTGVRSNVVADSVYRLFTAFLWCMGKCWSRTFGPLP